MSQNDPLEGLPTGAETPKPKKQSAPVKKLTERRNRLVKELEEIDKLLIFLEDNPKAGELLS
jgi:hypothetical protein